MRIYLVIVAACLLVGIGLGLLMGRGIWYSPSPSVVATTEAAAPGYTQPDHSRVLDKAPNPAPPPPPHAIPKGSTEIRRVSITVQPTISGTTTEQPAGTATSARPVTVDLSLVQDAHGSTRVVASSPNGNVIGGIDIPIASAPAPRNNWALITSNLDHSAYSITGGHTFHAFGFPIGIGAGLVKPEQGKVTPVIALKVDF